MGFAAEEQFKSFLSYQKGTFAKADYPSEELILELASTHHSKKLNTILKDFGTLSELKETGSVNLMDLLFLCDVLVNCEDVDGNKVTVSIDITSDFKKVYRKESEIFSKRHTLKKLGVDRALVIVWKVENFQSIDRAQSYILAGKIIDRLDSNKSFVNTVMLTDEDLE